MKYLRAMQERLQASRLRARHIGAVLIALIFVAIKEASIPYSALITVYQALSQPIQGYPSLSQQFSEKKIVYFLPMENSSRFWNHVEP